MSGKTNQENDNDDTSFTTNIKKDHMINTTTTYNNHNMNDSGRGLSLSLKDEKEALMIADIARRAEERAEQRAMARALEERKRKRELLYQNDKQNSTILHGSSNSNISKIQFVSKRFRRTADKTTTANQQSSSSTTATTASSSLSSTNDRNKSSSLNPPIRTSSHSNGNSNSNSSSKSHLTDAVISSVKRSYLGNNSSNGSNNNNHTDNNNNHHWQDTRNSSSNSSNKKQTQHKSKKTIFKFEWDAKDDTTRQQEYGALEELYGNIVLPTASRQSSQSRSFNHDHRRSSSHSNGSSNSRVMDVTNKPLGQMTSRDWRIFRENYNIVVRGAGGGKVAPPPLRQFNDVKLHPDLLHAIQHVCHYKVPSPIQRQAIPIGLQRRDLIGIAETGSGKTAAFGIPLCQFVLNLPHHILTRVPEEGPLALVLAPTRELALQIHVEFTKFLTTVNKKNKMTIQTTVVVGGQSIQNQAMILRKGVHIVVGTPGRLNDCLDMRYLVLNQCCYIVLDEADRMIDLGFAPQMESILENMGGVLKSDDDQQQEQNNNNSNNKATDEDIIKYRITAMFSATMPPEVERLAKNYLRKAAIVSIGGQDEGKNARITQRIVYLSHPSQKEKALRDILNKQNNNSHHNYRRQQQQQQQKILIFVNEKKHADGVSRLVERMIPGGRNGVVVLHGGKTQEQREEALDAFKRGGVIMVATDVAGRGLDINNITHVINYDLPQRSNIDAYCHRIGRTGRAGKEGLATSFLTDEDESIMPSLVSYLQQTKNHIPDRLAKHPCIRQSNERPHAL